MKGDTGSLGYSSYAGFIGLKRVWAIGMIEHGVWDSGVWGSGWFGFSVLGLGF